MNDNETITNCDKYFTRTDFCPEISDSVPSSIMIGSVWLRYITEEPRWNDLMDKRTNCE